MSREGLELQGEKYPGLKIDTFNPLAPAGGSHGKAPQNRLLPPQDGLRDELGHKTRMAVCQRLVELPRSVEDLTGLRLVARAELLASLQEQEFLEHHDPEII